MDVTQRNARFALLLGQFIILLVCGFYIYYEYKLTILPDKEVKSTYQQAECMLMSKKLSIKGRLVDQYRADFLVNYNVNGLQYARWVSGNGLDTSPSRDESAQENLLSQYEVGVTYMCWYNPEKPQMVVLVLRHDWLSTFSLMIPAVIGILTLYYFLKHAYRLLPPTRSKRKKIRARTRKK